MIICIFGKSGSGKSYLAKKLSKDIPNSIHIDMDVLNRDLLKTKSVITQAQDIFSSYNIMEGTRLNSQVILQAIIRDSKLYQEWTNYMINVCNSFLTNYIKSTNFKYYIIDHINAPKLDICKENSVYIECKLDKASRLLRLQKRENITNEILNFRDDKYIDTSSDIIYDNDNYEKVLKFILSF